VYLVYNIGKLLFLLALTLKELVPSRSELICANLTFAIRLFEFYVISFVPGFNNFPFIISVSMPEFLVLVFKILNTDNSADEALHQSKILFFVSNQAHLFSNRLGTSNARHQRRAAKTT
jgi:hypothetical protein